MSIETTCVALLGQQWEAAARSPLDWLGWVALGAAGLLGLGFLWLLWRAWREGGRYRATGVLGEAERRELAQEIERAERDTDGEIVVVVLERSDRHPAAAWVAATLALLLGTAATARWMPWEQPALFLTLQVAYAGLGMLAALRLPGFRRVFVSEERASECAREQAFQEFYRHGLHRTEAGTGVLLFVSLLERRAIVLGDEGIDSKLSPTHWEETNRAILEGIRASNLKDGLERGIRLCAQVLAQHFPASGANPDEVANHVIVRAE